MYFVITKDVYLSNWFSGKTFDYYNCYVCKGIIDALYVKYKIETLNFSIVKISKIDDIPFKYNEKERKYIVNNNIYNVRRYTAIP